MCGIFGFIGSKDKRVQMKRLRAIARDTETRGHHAFGFAWIDGAGRLKMFKQTGRISDHLGLLAMASDAEILIGHCRWATHGSPEDNSNNHPFPCDGGWLVHNGVIMNDEQLLEARDLHRVGECDSEALALTIEDMEGGLLERTAESIDLTTGALAIAALWHRPRQLVLARRGNPLWRSDTNGRTYFASRPDALPGSAKPLVDNRTQLITFGKENHVRHVRSKDATPRRTRHLACVRPGKATPRR